MNVFRRTPIVTCLDFVRMHVDPPMNVGLICFSDSHKAIELGVVEFRRFGHTVKIAPLLMLDVIPHMIFMTLQSGEKARKGLMFIDALESQSSHASHVVPLTPSLQEKCALIG